jgi:hypothetical protein
MMADRMKSPAYEVLRASSRRLLLFIEQEIARAKQALPVMPSPQPAVLSAFSPSVLS